VRVTRKNVIDLGNKRGRLRWKTENEGFNVQKNGEYKLEHAYTKDENGMKVLYFILQLAHMLAQLILRGSLLRGVFPSGPDSAKNFAFRVLEAWRNAVLTQAQYSAFSSARFQIRFDSS